MPYSNMMSGVSYIPESKTTKAVFNELESPKTPSIVARNLRTSVPNISRALGELQSGGLTECLTPGSG